MLNFQLAFSEVKQSILSGSRSFLNLGFRLPRRDLVRDRDENEIPKYMKYWAKTTFRPIN
jgi:hypothetical protein